MTDLLNYINNTLPQYIFSNKSEFTDFMRLTEEEILSSLDGLFNDKVALLGYNQGDCSLTYIVRNLKNKYNSSLEKIILLKLNKTCLDEEGVIAMIYVNEFKAVRYFRLIELESNILPKTYIKNDERFLLMEVEEGFNLKNWGKLLNPRNLSDITNSLSLLNQ